MFWEESCDSGFLQSWSYNVFIYIKLLLTHVWEFFLFFIHLSDLLEACCSYVLSRYLLDGLDWYSSHWSSRLLRKHIDIWYLCDSSAHFSCFFSAPPCRHFLRLPVLKHLFRCLGLSFGLLVGKNLMCWCLRFLFLWSVLATVEIKINHLSVDDACCNIRLNWLCAIFRFFF